MVDDIVERLRDLWTEQEKKLTWNNMEAVTNEAADEIEQLRRDIKVAIMGDSAELRDAKKEIENLREALRPFASIEPLFSDSDEMEFELWFLIKSDRTIDRPMIKVGDLRAAKAALERK